MKLQIAVDIADTETILKMVEKIHDVIDIFEVGTPVIMKEGMGPVRALKKKYPNLCVLADTKIVDGGSIEAEDVCEAGADILTVLAMSDDETIREVCDVAHKYGRKVMADLICVKEIAQRSRQMIDLGLDYVCVHTGVDMQKQGRTSLLDLKQLIDAIEPAKAAVAGGINLQTLDSYIVCRPEIIVAGSALYNASDIRKAVIDMKGHF